MKVRIYHWFQGRYDLPYVHNDKHDLDDNTILDLIKNYSVCFLHPDEGVEIIMCLNPKGVSFSQMG